MLPRSAASFGALSLGLLLVFLAALSWTAFDAVRKSLSRKVMPSLLGTWLPLGQALLLTLWALPQGRPAFPNGAWRPGAVSAAFTVVALLLFLQALRRSPLSLTVPLLGFTPVGATLLAWLVRHQQPTGCQWLGIALVVAGGVLLGARSSRWPGLRAYLREPGVWRMALAALLWSCTGILDQMALQRGANVWYAPALSLSVGGALLLWVLASGHARSVGRSLRTLAATPRLTVAALLTGAAGLALQLQGLRSVPAGLVETIVRGVDMGGAVILGAVVFREAVGLARIGAVLLLATGVALVALGA